MAVRNILDRLNDGGETVDDTYFFSTPLFWEGPGIGALGIVNFFKTNDLCLIHITPFTIPTVTTAAEFVGSMPVPMQMWPKGGVQFVQTLNKISNGNNSVGCTYFNTNDHFIRFADQHRRLSYFTDGPSIAGLAILVVLCTL